MRFDTGRCAREEGAFGVLGVLVDLGRETLFGGHDENNIMIGSDLSTVERQAFVASQLRGCRRRLRAGNVHGSAQYFDKRTAEELGEGR